MTTCSVCRGGSGDASVPTLVGVAALGSGILSVHSLVQDNQDSHAGRLIQSPRNASGVTPIHYLGRKVRGASGKCKRFSATVPGLLEEISPVLQRAWHAYVKAAILLP